MEVCGNDDSGDIGISYGEQFHQSSQLISMVIVFGESTGEDGGLGNPRMLRKVIIIGEKYGDYVK